MLGLPEVIPCNCMCWLFQDIVIFLPFHCSFIYSFIYFDGCINRLQILFPYRLMLLCTSSIWNFWRWKQMVKDKLCIFKWSSMLFLRNNHFPISLTTWAIFPTLIALFRFFFFSWIAGLLNCFFQVIFFFYQFILWLLRICPLPSFKVGKLVLLFGVHALRC